METDAMMQKRTRCVLGIETTCDETASAVILRDEEGRGHILSERIRSQIPCHALHGGVVPEIAARAHGEVLGGLISSALVEAGVGFEDLDGIAVSGGPGLVGGLLVGMSMARALALVHEKALLILNHLEGHALSVRLLEPVVFPYLLFLLSGGHTQILEVRGVGDYRRLGTTIDDALGEAFDKTGKMLGLGYPAGSAVESEAKRGDAGRFSLPRPLCGREELHFSFSGLKTAVRRVIEQNGPLDSQMVSDICAGFQVAICDVLRDRAERAILFQHKRAAERGLPEVQQLVLAGGVAANEMIRGCFADLCERLGMRFFVPPAFLCGDNASMIAWAGAERLASGVYRSHPSDFSVPPRPRWPLDLTAESVRGAGVKA